MFVRSLQELLSPVELLSLPQPNRGRRNDSSQLRYVVRRIAEVKGLTEEAVAAATAENARRLFNI